MEEPAFIIPSHTRIRTHERLGSVAGLMVSENILALRRPNAVGAICGIVAGHGGDIYWVAHVGAVRMVPYGWMEFELEPTPDPKCEDCQGSGIDFPTSAREFMGTACSYCNGTGSAPPRPRPTAWERVQGDE